MPRNIPAGSKQWPTSGHSVTGNSADKPRVSRFRSRPNRRRNHEVRRVDPGTRFFDTRGSSSGICFILGQFSCCENTAATAGPRVPPIFLPSAPCRLERQVPEFCEREIRCPTAPPPARRPPAALSGGCQSFVSEKCDARLSRPLPSSGRIACFVCAAPKLIHLPHKAAGVWMLPDMNLRLANKTYSPAAQGGRGLDVARYELASR